MLHVLDALAEIRRALVQERTVAGLAAARARGRVGGRPQALSGPRLTYARTCEPSGCRCARSPRFSARVV